MAADLRNLLIVDPGEQPISSPTTHVNLEGSFTGSKSTPTTVSLGQLQVDNAGRLVFIGGAGYSQSVAEGGKPQPEIISEFDSVDWVDDVCDGWVGVEVSYTNWPNS